MPPSEDATSAASRSEPVSTQNSCAATFAVATSAQAANAQGNTPGRAATWVRAGTADAECMVFALSRAAQAAVSIATREFDGEAGVQMGASSGLALTLPSPA